MWKNSLKNVESDNNKILCETLLDFFLQRNGAYCLNKPRINNLGACCLEQKVDTCSMLTKSVFFFIFSPINVYIILAAVNN